MKLLFMYKLTKFKVNSRFYLDISNKPFNLLHLFINPKLTNVKT